MSDVAPPAHPAVPPAGSTSSRRAALDPWRLTVGCAAVGAGLIHAAVIAGHAEEVTLSRLFLAAAVVGVGSGIAVLTTTRRWVVAATVAVHAVFLGSWIVTRTVGISFIGGLSEREPIGFADAVAAGLALVVVVGGVVLLRTGDRPTTNWVSMALAPVVPIVVVALTVPALISGSGHQHDDGEVHTHEEAAGAGHHDDGAPATDEASEHAHSDDEPAAEHEHVEAQPFDPAAPVDLSGTEGVTQVQQKEAEVLLAKTLEALPFFADPTLAESLGYHSIGDGLTGDEHFINWAAIDDQHVLDPQHPEALVYNTRKGTRSLEAAMFIMPTGFNLENVPPIGGKLIQWHIHDNLCFTIGDKPSVAGVTSSNGPCGPGLQRFTPSPMIHVWIQKNPCGPFSALEGVGAGQVKAGETRSCDHDHGSNGSTF